MRLHIHEAAKRLGTTPRAIRFYEDKGLLSPQKSPNGYRTYDDRDLLALRWIVSLRGIGLPVSAVKELARGIEPGDCELQSGSGPLEKLEETRQDVYREWSKLSRALTALDELLAAGNARGRLPLHSVEEAAQRLRDSAALVDEWQDPMDFGSLAEKYKERAVTEALRPFIDEADYARTHETIVQWLDPRSGEHGCEAGAGTGRLTAMLAAAGAAMTAVEQSPAMLRHFRERLPNIEAVHGNVLALPFQRPRFHFAACAFALHSLDRRRQRQALDEIDRVLLPGGRLCLAGVTLPASGPRSRGADKPACGGPSGISPESAFHDVDLGELELRLSELGYQPVRPDAGPGAWILYAVKREAT
ncbi:MerR family transcriptional regulator [Paenibacillus humicola]|uniref:MerR family transcriptional regulator n=1 Tax=Paenibacillus humicola TaxID=3110540 RepID=UPI00237B6A10|nr:MerR family transcriptional regulator [Paenibacillus humicola]